jgi:hypothetical protein
MAVDLQNANSFVFELIDERLAASRDRDHLPGDGLAVFHACNSDVLMRDFQASGQVADELFRRNSGLFDTKEEEFPRLQRGISGNFLNDEVLGTDLAAT